AELVFDPVAPPLKGEALERLMRDFLAVNLANQRLAQRFHPEFLEELVDSERFSPDWPEKKVVAWADEVASRMNSKNNDSVQFELEVVKGEEGYDLMLRKRVHGVTDEKRIGLAFFLGSDYRLIGRLAEALHGLVQEGAEVRRGNATSDIESFRDVFEWLMSESRKGRTIQRFKGLGEMNPDQLWDTTVNPETRRLLQVTIEDAVAADQIFTTLMGDEVEPRRNFIEENALKVANLDV
ncbi:MAG: DNA gyrase subunit B, partial [Desulfobulbia bacterium]